MNIKNTYMLDNLSDSEDELEEYLFDDYYKSYGTIIRLALFAPSIYILFFCNLKFLKNNLYSDLIQYCKNNLSFVKCPKSWEFKNSLPREDNGKLYKNKL